VIFHRMVDHLAATRDERIRYIKALDVTGQVELYSVENGKRVDLRDLQESFVI